MNILKKKPQHDYRKDCQVLSDSLDRQHWQIIEQAAVIEKQRRKLEIQRQQLFMARGQQN